MTKRIKALIKNYEKPLEGTLAAIEIGLSKIRSACPHFNEWYLNLEKLI